MQKQDGVKFSSVFYIELILNKLKQSDSNKNNNIHPHNYSSSSVFFGEKHKISSFLQKRKFAKVNTIMQKFLSEQYDKEFLYLCTLIKNDQ